MSVIAVGDFDGVHLGHQLLLKKLNCLATKTNDDSLVLTFDTVSKSFFQTEAIQMLTLPTEKEHLLRSFGVHSVKILSFDSTFVNLTAPQFLDKLKHEFDCNILIGGEDFSFGFGASGKLCDGDSVSGILQRVVTFSNNSKKISSSLIRNAVLSGDLKKANQMLGYQYALTGRVIPGKQIGRMLDFPTVNLMVDARKLLPKNGVYSTSVEIEGKRYPSVTNIGIRPTIDDSERLSIETHIIGFHSDLYGQNLSISFTSRIREERHFMNFTELKTQIALDCEVALKEFC